MSDSSSLPFSAEETIRTACQDSGVNVAYMDWHDGELILVISFGKKLTLHPKMEDLYGEVRRALEQHKRA